MKTPPDTEGNKAISRVIRKHQVTQIVPLSGRQIDRLEAQGKFPQRIQLSPNSVGWFEHEVRNWLEHRPRGHLPPLSIGPSNIESKSTIMRSQPKESPKGGREYG